MPMVRMWCLPMWADSREASGGGAGQELPGNQVTAKAVSGAVGELGRAPDARDTVAAIRLAAQVSQVMHLGRTMEISHPL